MSLRDSDLARDEQHALKGPKNDEKWNLNFFFFLTEGIHNFESCLHKYDCFTEIEKELDDALRKGDFDDINQKVTPKTLASCKSNTLLKTFQVSLITLP